MMYNVSFRIYGTDVYQTNLVRTNRSPVEVGHYYRDVKNASVYGVTVATADDVKPGKPIVTI